MSYKNIEGLSEEYRAKRPAIRKRLKEYAAVPEQQYFYELLYCLMTPQSSAVNAGKAQALFEAADLLHAALDPEPVLRSPAHYIRFHRTKARHILRMKEQYQEILAVTIGPMTSEEKRLWLVKNVKGLSFKEATHFLRNIGRNGGLTILDRHILKHLKNHGVIRSIPAALSKKHYLAIERKFLAFADHIGISVDDLDLLFWSRETGVILK